MGYRDCFVAHDGSEGLSPVGWLPDRMSIGVLTRVFTPELVDEAVDSAGAREQRRLEARLAGMAPARKPAALRPA